ncbi:MAG: hypothetical protein J6B48_01965 [Clostridia bacterium]|nr:hypothetical protein [Clostridia bacterium]
MNKEAKKARYDSAEIEALYFEVSDIVTASTPEEWSPGGIDGEGWDEN